jgi:serine/threonine protein kinase
VHRDLKPENILLCPRQAQGGGGSSGIVLCDFGTAEPAPGSQVGCTAADLASAAAEHAAAWAAPPPPPPPPPPQQPAPGSSTEDEEGPIFQPPPSRWEGFHYGHVTTMPFRAPELVMGALAHTPAVDAWALGVVCAEVLRCALQLSYAAAALGAQEGKGEFFLKVAPPPPLPLAHLAPLRRAGIFPAWASTPPPSSAHPMGMGSSACSVELGACCACPRPVCGLGGTS